MEPQLANLTRLVALDVLGLDGPSHGERPVEPDVQSQVSGGVFFM